MAQILPDDIVSNEMLLSLKDTIPPTWATCNVMQELLAYHAERHLNNSKIEHAILEGNFRVAEQVLNEIFTTSETPELDIVKLWINYQLKEAAELSGDQKTLWIENLSSNLRDSEEYSKLFDHIIYNRTKKNDIFQIWMDREDAESGTAKLENDALVEEEPLEQKENASEIEVNTETEANQAERSINEQILEELDVGKRADMLINLLRQKLDVDSSLIEAEDIVSNDSDWNFVLLAFLFLRHPNLNSGVDSYLGLAKELQFLKISLHALNQIDRRNMGTQDQAIFNQRLNFVCGEITRLKKRVDDKMRYELNGHKLYRLASDRILEMSFVELARRARGMEGAVSSQEMAVEKRDYTRLNRAKIQDLLKNDDNPEEELQKLEKYLGTRFQDLRKIYKAYAAQGGSDGGGASSISMSEFMSLVKDSRLTDKAFTMNDVDLIFIRTNWEIDEEGRKINVANNPDRALTSNEYVEALVRCAYGRYKVKAQTNLCDCVERMFENNIIPYAQRSDADAFRKSLAAKKVREIFTKHEKRLKRLYTRIAGEDGMINCKEFSDLLYRKKIVDGKTLTTKNVLKIFNNVQEDGDPVEGEDDLMDMEMSYSEFLEALAAVASFCNPDPYIAFEQRLEIFLLVRMGAEGGRR